MRGIVMLAALAVAFSAWSQAEKPKPEEATQEPPPKPATIVAKKPNPKRFEDARHCLERPTNTEIIKCAEEYL